jgi:hypothetical protein
MIQESRRTNPVVWPRPVAPDSDLLFPWADIDHSRIASMDRRGLSTPTLFAPDRSESLVPAAA